MNHSKSAFILMSLAGVFSITGCIQEDPQVEALRAGFQAAEQEIAELKKQLASGQRAGSGAAASSSGAPEMEAENALLRIENAKLKANASQSFVPLSKHEMLARLQQKSGPLQEGINDLYEVLDDKEHKEYLRLFGKVYDNIEEK